MEAWLECMKIQSATFWMKLDIKYLLKTYRKNNKW